MATARKPARQPRKPAPMALRESRPFVAGSRTDPLVKALLKRSYSAAQRTRLNSDWTVSHLGPNEEIRQALQTLRAASRDLERNSDLYKRYLWLVESNVVHRGFALESQPMNPRGGIDLTAARQIERAWRDWGRGKVTLDGQMTWAEVQRLAIRTIARDGELVCILHRSSGTLRLEVLEPDHLPVDVHVPTRRTALGIEHDATGAPSAYWITDRHPGEGLMGGSSGYVRGHLRRFDAGEVVHPFRRERWGQTRGVPWGVAAFDDLLMLGGYKVAELAAARINAARPASVETEVIADQPYKGDGDTRDKRKPIEFDGAPGGFTILDPGQKLVYAPAEHPATAYGPFTMEIKRDIAAGLGVSYHALNSDLSGGNFSSLRHGRADEVRWYEGCQEFLARCFHDPIFLAWLELWLSSSETALPLSRFDKFAAHVWAPPVFEPLDPLKEAQAMREELDLGITTWSELVARRGKELRAMAERRADDEEILRAAGVILPGMGGTAAASPAAQPGEKPKPGDDDAEDTELEDEELELEDGEDDGEDDAPARPPKPKPPAPKPEDDADAEPAAPAAPAAPAPPQLLNGAQVESVLEVVSSVASGALPKDSAKQILKLAFGFDDASVAAIIDPVTPRAPDASANAQGADT